MHPGTYQCQYCSQTMSLDEPMIIDHLKHCAFSEFECLKCEYGSNDIEKMREHIC
jgi:5-methylcytosine-specific restriction endonuclease McrA